ncbi:hypothetical protein H4R19_003898, partial [Coemansia spiralis]
MLLNEIPTDILILVLRRSRWPAGGGSEQNAFLRSLGLLAVCRQWRHLALPLVYGTAYIEHNTTTKPDTKSKRVGMATNVGLAAAIGCIHVVRRVAITVRYLDSPLPGLGAAIEQLRAAAAEWTGVRALQLTLIPATATSFGQRGTDGGPQTSDPDTAADALAALLPAVRHLQVAAPNQCVTARALFGRLAGCYAGQLLVLRSRCPIAVPDDRMFAVLRDVVLCGAKDHNNQLPHMNPDCIERLKLTGFPATHPWAAFATNADSPMIELPRLRRIDAVYASTPHYSNERRYSLCFPALDRLAVTCFGAECPLLETMVLPQRMRAVSITAGAPVFRSIASAVLPAAKRLQLQVDLQPMSDPAALAAVNQVLTSAPASAHKELHIKDDSLLVLPSTITCSDLTRLVVAAPTSMDGVLGLIRNLPSLTSLAINTLTLDDIHPDTELLATEAHAPLATCICELALGFSRRQYSPELAATAAILLALKTPALSRLCTRQLPHD